MSFLLLTELKLTTDRQLLLWINDLSTTEKSFLPNAAKEGRRRRSIEFDACQIVLFFLLKYNIVVSGGRLLQSWANYLIGNFYALDVE